MHRVAFVQCVAYRVDTIEADGFKDFTLSATFEDALHGIAAIVGPVDTLDGGIPKQRRAELAEIGMVERGLLALFLLYFKEYL